MSREELFFIDEIMSDAIESQILGRNFKSRYEELDGKIMRVPFGGIINIGELLGISSEGLTITSNRAGLIISNGIVKLNYVGDANLVIFPSQFPTEYGIVIKLEIYVTKAEELQAALENPQYSNIYIGAGVFPGFKVDRKVTIVGSGESTIIVPREEYYEGISCERYYRKIDQIREEIVISGHGEIGIDPIDVELMFTSNESTRPCSSKDGNCINSFAKRRMEYIDNDKCVCNYKKNMGNCGDKTKGVSQIDNGEGIIRVDSNEVYIENMIITAECNSSDSDIIIGICISSTAINKVLEDIEINKVIITLPSFQNGCIGIYMGQINNLAVLDSAILIHNIEGGRNNNASISVCDIRNALVDGLYTNSRFFIGGRGCTNGVDSVSRLTMVEDTVAIEGNGGELEYYDHPSYDIEGAIKTFLRDTTNRFKDLGVFDSQYPQYRAMYRDELLEYVVLVKRELL